MLLIWGCYCNNYRGNLSYIDALPLCAHSCCNTAICCPLQGPKGEVMVYRFTVRFISHRALRSAYPYAPLRLRRLTKTSNILGSRHPKKSMKIYFFCHSLSFSLSKLVSGHTSEFRSRTNVMCQKSENLWCHNNDIWGIHAVSIVIYGRLANITLFTSPNPPESTSKQLIFHNFPGGHASRRTACIACHIVPSKKSPPPPVKNPVWNPAEYCLIGLIYLILTYMHSK